jgi:SAM-dependent methyltransferase
VLEIGCGAGLWSAELAKRGARVTALDVAPPAARAARRATAGRASALVADMHRLPFADRSFDAAFGSMVLHHSADPAALGRELARVLRPGAPAVFHENSAANPLLMLARRRLVGRLGIRRTSSPGEHPLRRSEIRRLAAAFAEHRVVVGRMVLVQLLPRAVLGHEAGPLLALARGLDDALFHLAPPLRPMSYYQVVAFRAAL